LQLTRGARLTEILKQGQYMPLPVEQQILQLLAIHVAEAVVARLADGADLAQLPDYYLHVPGNPALLVQGYGKAV
ncbi:MAG TPA: hypothetical protein EYO90_07415, partial [Candidatus Latescibacteria bacterium]|nr:hypothetical protein [Candidatus Latescibacterota bacterium]